MKIRGLLVSVSSLSSIWQHNLTVSGSTGWIHDVAILSCFRRVGEYEAEVGRVAQEQEASEWLSLKLAEWFK